jgi:hypothetical protein
MSEPLGNIVFTFAYIKSAKIYPAVFAQLSLDIKVLNMSVITHVNACFVCYSFVPSPTTQKWWEIVGLGNIPTCVSANFSGQMLD